MDGRCGPIGRAFHMAMAHRIKPAIVQMPLQILRVAAMMLPEALLPDAQLAFARLKTGAGWWRDQARAPGIAAEAGLDAAPALRIIHVIDRQSPDRVQMIGQNNPRDTFQRAIGQRVAHRRAQNGQVIEQGSGSALRKADGEKHRPGRSGRAAIIGHAKTIIAIDECLGNADGARSEPDQELHRPDVAQSGRNGQIQQGASAHRNCRVARAALFGLAICHPSPHVPLANVILFRPLSPVTRLSVFRSRPTKPSCHISWVAKVQEISRWPKAP
jgi:hypothetical protein